MDTLWVFEASAEELKLRLSELQAAADGHARCAVIQSVLGCVKVPMRTGPAAAHIRNCNSRFSAKIVSLLGMSKPMLYYH
jgi:hypothetical protein